MPTLPYSLMYAPCDTIEFIVKDSISFSHDSYFAKLNLLTKELVKGNDVVELGTGETPQRVLFQFKPKSYTCVEARPFAKLDFELPSFAKFESGIDAVNYLRKLPDNSVTTVSSAFFDRAILADRAYAEELVRLIHKKTKPNGLALHLLSDYESLFKRYRFKEEESIGWLKFLRKC